MNILVCISKTPETTAKIEFSADGKSFVSDGVNFIMNPYDEWFALVRALELKESHGGEVTVINVGTAENDTVIRKGLAIGADKAVRINKNSDSAWDTAHQLASYIKQNNFDLIFLGKETIDYNGSEVGAMLAEHLDLPFLSFVSTLEYDGTNYKAHRDIEGGVEIVGHPGPFVLSAAKGLAEQRIPNMRGIMMAKRKPLDVVEPVETTPNVSVSQFSKPPAKAGVKMIDPENMDELVQLLNQEAKVI
jgi:electron transfer flavoprotein beta subunit